MAVREEQMCPVPPADEYVNRTWTVEYFSGGNGKNHRTGRAMGDCNGGQGWYGTRINKDKGEHSKNGQQAKRCLEKAFGGIHWKWGKEVGTGKITLNHMIILIFLLRRLLPSD